VKTTHRKFQFTSAAWSIRLCISFGLVSYAAPGFAGTNYVTTTEDSGIGSLRQTILDANAAGGATILFSNVSGSITLSSELPPITGNLNICGPGANALSLSGGGVHRLFTFLEGSSNFITGLTLTHGRTSTNQVGGPILNRGTLTIFRCVIISNVSENGASGAIYNSGTLTVIASAISENQAVTPSQTGSLSLGQPGLPGYGGGIYHSSGTARVINCTLQGNRVTGGRGVDYSQVAPYGPGGPGGAGHGGALFVESGAVMLNHCLVLTNRARGGAGGGSYGAAPGAGGNAYGGAIAVNAGAVQLNNCVLLNNSAVANPGGGGANTGGPGGAAYGGAVFIAGGSLAFSYCTVSLNSALGGDGLYGFRGGGEGGKAGGGGIAATGGEWKLVSSTLAANQTLGGTGAGAACYPPLTASPRVGGDAMGGGAYVHGIHCVVELINSTLSSNTASGGQGGLYVCDTMRYYAESGTAGGGGIYSSTGSVSVINCTVAANIALTNSTKPALGGGIVSSNDVRMESSLIAGNIATRNPDCAGSFTSRGFNLVRQTNGAIGWLDSDLLNLDPGLGPLQDNGGPTLTHALLAGSPAIDAGKSSDDLLLDQRNQPRRVDNPAVPNAPGGDGTDIGALEVDHVLRCTEARRVGSNILVRFTSVSDKTYGIQEKPDIISAAWSTLPGVISGSGGIVTATNGLLPDSSTGFYRAFERAP
jgi:hypothetical protein